MIRARTTLAALCSTLSAAAGAAAQDLLPAAPPQPGPIAIVGGTVHTVTGDPPIEGGYILIEEGVIAEMGAEQREFDRGRAADAFGRAAHQRVLAGEVEVHVSLLAARASRASGRRLRVRCRRGGRPGARSPRAGSRPDGSG